MCLVLSQVEVYIFLPIHLWSCRVLVERCRQNLWVFKLQHLFIDHKTHFSTSERHTVDACQVFLYLGDTLRLRRVLGELGNREDGVMLRGWAKHMPYWERVQVVLGHLVEVEVDGALLRLVQSLGLHFPYFPEPTSSRFESHAKLIESCIVLWCLGWHESRLVTPHADAASIVCHSYLLYFLACLITNELDIHREAKVTV